MNIAIYTSSGYPSGGPGEHLVAMLCRGLNIHCYNVDLVLVRGNNTTQILKKNDKIKLEHILFKQIVDNDIINLIEVLITFILLPFSILKKYYLDKTNIFILYGLEYPYYSLPFVILRIIGIKVYRIITDDYDKNLISPHGFKIAKWWLYRAQVNFIDKYLNGVICLTNGLAKNAIGSGVKRENICIIPHFINVEGPVKGSFKSSNKKVLGYCGTFSDANGYEDLLKAFKLLSKEFNQLKLYLIGEPGTANRKKIADMVEGKDSNVIITGYLKKKDVESKLAECDILVNPRRRGKVSDAGFPTKLGEYFAAKLPVVSTKTGDYSIYFTDGEELILVEPNNPSDLAVGVCKLLQDPCLASKIAENGYLWAKSNVDYRVSAGKLLSFVQGLS